jgi:hypothetical protein
MTTQAQSPYLTYLTAKKNLKAAEARFELANAALTADVQSPADRAEWSKAIEVFIAADITCEDAYIIAYPQPDVEVTSAHVIVRKLGLANLLEADRIVKEQHAVGNLKFTRIFRGEAKRIADEEASFELSI